MINIQSLDAVENVKFSHSFIKPLYNSYCFSNIPQTIKNILLNEKKEALPDDVFGNFPQSYNKVVLLLVDGFGWKFFEQYADKYPFLKCLKDSGIVSKLTAQFPSTTPAELTTIHTGMPVGEHGVYEWVYYEPKVDALISPLLFSFAGKRIRDTLIPTGIDPKELFPTKTLYKELKEANIASYVFLSSEYARSAYTDVVLKGADIVPYDTIVHGLTQLTEKLLKDQEKGYYYFYFGGIDYLAHHYGSDSEQFETEVDNFLSAMENIFFKKISNKLVDTLFIMTADHGHIPINPNSTIYLNKQFSGITQCIKTNKTGELIVPAGSCRDLFLHIKEESLEKTYKYLKKGLKEKAEVYLVSELIKKNFFGSSISEAFLERVGNLLILPYDGESVWWYEKDRFEITYLGHHGGLTREEMEVPFACFPL